MTFLGPITTGSLLICERARYRHTDSLSGLSDDDAEEGREFVALVPIHASSLDAQLRALPWISGGGGAGDPSPQCREKSSAG